MSDFAPGQKPVHNVFGCADCGRTDKATFRTNPKGVRGIFKCRPCIDGVPRIGLGQDRELLDAIGLGVEPPPNIRGGSNE